MSQQFTIQSLVADPYPYVGITNNGQTYVPVRLNPQTNAWTTSDQGFSIGGFSYTGVQNEVVVVSNDPGVKVQWGITPVAGCGGSVSYNIIDVNTNQLWTVSDRFDDNSEIVVQDRSSDYCDETQLFQLTFPKN